MKLDEIFSSRGYDMVVAVTIDAINRQLQKLGDSGVISDTSVILM